MARPRRGFRIGAMLCVIACALAAQATPDANAPTVNEQILDILLEQGSIDRDRYDALSREAQEEKRLLARARAMDAEADVGAPAAQSAGPAGSAESPDGWKIYWRDRVHLERNDGLVKLRFGGVTQFEIAGSVLDDDLKTLFPDAEGSGVSFRRARIASGGSIGEHVFFKAVFDFAGGDVVFNDVFVGMRELPAVGSVRLGHFFEPVSFEQQTNSHNTMFMERSLPVLAFSPGRNSGIGLRDTIFDGRMTWSLGGFRDTGDDGSGFSNQGNYDLGARLTTLPVWEEDGRVYLHTGFWYSHQFRNDEPLQYESDPESNTVGVLTSMPEIMTDGVDLVGVELAFVRGPLAFQTEYVHSFVKGSGEQRDVDFFGSSMSASWFLTGEHRVYDQTTASFGRTRPTNPFSLREGSYGALELAARWSFLHLSDRNVRGGILNDFTAGVNWYLYSNLRLMANYVLAHRNGIGNAHVLQSRVSLDF